MRRLIRWTLLALFVFAVIAGALTFTGLKYAFEPGPANVLSRTRPSPEAYDLWGRTFTHEEAQKLLQTPEGKTQLSPANGAVKVDTHSPQVGQKFVLQGNVRKRGVPDRCRRYP